MEFNKIYTSEFLSELNLVLTQENFSGRMQDVLEPIQNLLQKDNDLLTYSLAKYCGASSRLAFACEWYLLASTITLDPSPLVEQNKEHFLKRVDGQFSSLNSLQEIVDRDINDSFLPLQLGFLNFKAKEFIDEQLVKHPAVIKYFNSSFLSQFAMSELVMNKSLYSDRATLNQYIEIQGQRSSFIYVCLPCLIGFTYSFNKQDHFVNPKGIKWGQLEEIFRQIATLHQMKDDPSFVRVVYEASLSKEEEVGWMSKDKQLQYSISSQSEAANEVVQMLREKTFEKLNQDIQSIVFPEKYKDLIKDLAHWAYEFDSSELKLVM
ncbi:MAG: hypothetical protein AAGF07_03490 [Patescibacteria group bacterium]